MSYTMLDYEREIAEWERVHGKNMTTNPLTLPKWMVNDEKLSD
jgi:hypothetical protein